VTGLRFDWTLIYERGEKTYVVKVEQSRFSIGVTLGAGPRLTTLPAVPLQEYSKATRLLTGMLYRSSLEPYFR
jgi:hypothetical protein